VTLILVVEKFVAMWTSRLFHGRVHYKPKTNDTLEDRKILGGKG